MTDPVVIAAFRVRTEADVARDAMLAAGMAADVSTRTDAYPRMCDDLFGDGFDLIVDRSDASAALAIVQHLWPDEPRAAAAVAQCPACGSTAVVRLPRLRIFVVTAAFLVLLGELTQQRDLFLLVVAVVAVLLLITPPLRCRACGERWRGRGLPIADEPAETPPVICPRCGAEDTEAIPRRRENAWTLLVNYLLPPLILVWPFRPSRRCSNCAHEWR